MPRRCWPIASAEAEAAEATFTTARETERRARGPYDAAERAFGALEAEARTLSELLDLEKTAQFPPLIDSLEVAPGYEKALGGGARRRSRCVARCTDAPAYLGAARSPATRIRRFPVGAEPLVGFVEGPANLTRRLRQVGVVAEELGAALHAEPCARPAARHARRPALALGRLHGEARLRRLRRAPAGAARLASQSWRRS